MSSHDLALSFDCSSIPEVRKLLEEMEKPDLVENAIEAVYRSRELQVMFDSMKEPFEKSEPRILAADRRIVELTDQSMARDIRIGDLGEEAAKNGARIVELQKANDALTLQLTKKDEELKQATDDSAQRVEEIWKLTVKIGEQESASRVLQGQIQAKTTENKDVQAKLSAILREMEGLFAKHKEQSEAHKALEKQMEGALSVKESALQALRTQTAQDAARITAQDAEVATLRARNETLVRDAAARITAQDDEIATLRARNETLVRDAAARERIDSLRSRS